MVNDNLFQATMTGIDVLDVTSDLKYQVLYDKKDIIALFSRLISVQNRGVGSGLSQTALYLVIPMLFMHLIRLVSLQSKIKAAEITF